MRGVGGCQHQVLALDKTCFALALIPVSLKIAVSFFTILLYFSFFDPLSTSSCYVHPPLLIDGSGVEVPAGESFVS